MSLHSSKCRQTCLIALYTQASIARVLCCSGLAPHMLSHYQGPTQARHLFGASGETSVLWRRAWCQLCCGRGMQSIRTLFFSRHFLTKALPTMTDPLPTGAVTQSMNREAIQQVGLMLWTPRQHSASPGLPADHVSDVRGHVLLPG